MLEEVLLLLQKLFKKNFKKVFENPKTNLYLQSQTIGL